MRSRLVGVQAELILGAVERKARSAQPSNSTYLERRVEYLREGGQLVDEESQGVMMAWEGPLMQAHAKVLFAYPKAHTLHYITCYIAVTHAVWYAWRHVVILLISLQILVHQVYLGYLLAWISPTRPAHFHLRTVCLACTDGQSKCMCCCTCCCTLLFGIHITICLGAIRKQPANCHALELISLSCCMCSCSLCTAAFTMLLSCAFHPPPTTHLDTSTHSYYLQVAKALSSSSSLQ